MQTSAYIRLPKKKLLALQETANVPVPHSCPLLLPSSSKTSSAHYSLTYNATAKHGSSGLVQWPLHQSNELLKTQQSIPGATADTCHAPVLLFGGYICRSRKTCLEALKNNHLLKCHVLQIPFSFLTCPFRVTSELSDTTNTTLFHYSQSLISLTLATSEFFVLTKHVFQITFLILSLLFYFCQ